MSIPRTGRCMTSILTVALVLVGAILSGCGQSSNSTSINGAGASFPAPLYQRWFAEYQRANPGIKVSYQSTGSGAGVNQFIAGTVQFGASDVAMTPAEVAQVSRGAIMIPVTAGAVVVGYNLAGVPDLKLSRAALVGIFAGKVTRWNDLLIRATNPGVALPDQKISVVHRSDGSGTTAIFTSHLAAVGGAHWSAGAGKSIEWPTGIGAKGNEGVTARLLQDPGSIGYIEVSFAQQNGIKTAALENKYGQFVPYSAQAAADALANINLPENLVGFDADPAGTTSYPIVSYTWILVYRQYDNAAVADGLKKVLTWAVTDGQKFSEELGYTPLPAPVVARARDAIDSIGR